MMSYIVNPTHARDLMDYAKILKVFLEVKNNKKKTKKSVCIMKSINAC